MTPSIVSLIITEWEVLEIARGTLVHLDFCPQRSWAPPPVMPPGPPCLHAYMATGLGNKMAYAQEILSAWFQSSLWPPSLGLTATADHLRSSSYLPSRRNGGALSWMLSWMLRAGCSQPLLQLCPRGANKQCRRCSCSRCALLGFCAPGSLPLHSPIWASCDVV